MIRKLTGKYRLLSLPVRASMWFLVCSFLQKGISVISTPIFTRLLDTTQYGQYTNYIAWDGVISVFTTLNLSYGVYMQGLVKFDDDQDAFSSSVSGLATTLIVFFYCVYLLFMDFFNRLFSQSLLTMTCMFLSMWIMPVFRFWSVRERVENRYVKLVILTLVAAIGKPIAGVAAILLTKGTGNEVNARILSMVVVELIAFSGLFVLLMRRGRVFFHKFYWKYALAFNLPLIPHYLSQALLNESDRLMIKAMVSDSAAAIYSLAYSVAMLMTILNTAILSTLNPWLYKNIKKKQYALIRGVSVKILILVAAANLMLIAVGPECVHLFAPEAYHDAIWIIPPVAMSVPFIFMYSLFSAFEFYYEKTKYITYASVAGALLNVLLNYIFIREYGYAAAAYTTLACYIVYCVAHYLLMRVTLRQKGEPTNVYNPMALIMLMGAFLILGFLFLLTYSSAYLRYIMLFLLLIAAFCFRGRLIGLIRTIRAKDS